MGRDESKDRGLGLDRPITRRDFLGGAGAAAASAMVACAVPNRSAQTPLRYDPTGTAPADYPPAAMGMRGSHSGSFEVAHEIAFKGRTDWGPVTEPDDATYDLVVVGGGVSGLSAAYFYRRHNPNARILILENHGDFGGHARRNEFHSGGRLLLGYGGSQTMEAPGRYSEISKQLLRELHVEQRRFYQAYDRSFFKRNKLRTAVFFDRESYGSDRLVPFQAGWQDEPDYEYAPTGIPFDQSIAQMPISHSAKREMRRLYDPDIAPIADLPSVTDGNSFLDRISYKDFLAQYRQMTNPEVIKILHGLTSGSQVNGIDLLSASEAIGYGGLPGLSREVHRSFMKKYWGDEPEPYIHHFPDGNASIARLLVRSLIPDSASGDSMDDIVTASFDYGRLDQASARVRLRLNSTVVRAEHEGSAASAKQVAVTYVQNGQAKRVHAKSCVLACYNMMIPYLCPELPAEQREALSLAVKSPMIYTNVQLRNWHAWKKAGLGIAYCPGSYHQTAQLDYPVSIGDYQFPATPDQPIVIHMEHAPLSPDRGLTPREQYRLGRFQLLNTSFEKIERSLRVQLAGMLSSTGFDPATDIEGITVNRWPHGYTYSQAALVDDESDGGELPHIRGRKTMGRIAIANADAGGEAYINVAIDQAHRAVEELPS